MNDAQRIIETLKNQLHQDESIHAMWLEGSLADQDSDEYSDLDIWLSVDDDKLSSIYKNVENALESIAPIDFKLILKLTDELGHNVYHLKDMSEFLTLDINTQKLSRNVVLREGIDLYETIFDKASVIQAAPPPRDTSKFDKDVELAELFKFIDYTALSVRKNEFRGKKMESREYYRSMLIKVTEYLRKKSAISEKADFNFKHIYKDIPRSEAEKLEELYFAEVDNNTIESLKSWLSSI